MSAPQQTTSDNTTNPAPTTANVASGSSITTAQSPEMCLNVFNCITFAIVGKTLSKPHHDIEKLIVEHGGHFTTTITAKTDYLITNNEGYHEMTKLTKEAEHRHLVILDEKFIYDCVARGKFLPIKKYIIESQEKKGVRKADEMEEEIEVNAKWAWKSEAGWCQFVRVMNERIENAYEHYLRTKRNKICEIDTLRRVDFERMLIHCEGDVTPHRRIKREAVLAKETAKNHKKPKLDAKPKVDEKAAQDSTTTSTQANTSALPINA